MDSRAFTVKLADVNIAVRPLHGYIRRYCRDYLTEEPPALMVEICQADIDYERKMSEENDRLEGREPQPYPDHYLETLAVYRGIAHKLLPSGVLLVHGSCIAVDGEAYLFTAKSGTGKSTHTRLWRERFGQRAVMVNDDKPLLRLTAEGILAYGTPWSGKHGLSTNIALPLKAICILERGEENRIEPVEPGAAFPALLQQIYRPGDPGGLLAVVDLTERLVNTLPIYRLQCNMEPSAAEVSYGGMQ